MKALFSTILRFQPGLLHGARRCAGAGASG